MLEAQLQILRRVDEWLRDANSFITSENPEQFATYTWNYFREYLTDAVKRAEDLSDRKVAETEDQKQFINDYRVLRQRFDEVFTALAAKFDGKAAVHQLTNFLSAMYTFNSP